jgi:murein DD-endopeptidase MepM/ murein hydrolase activator NlpD
MPVQEEEALLPIHPLEERKLPPGPGTRFGAPRSATGRPSECGGGHCGVDLYYWKGEADRNIGIGRPVFAVADGKVIAASASSSAGKYVWIQHAGAWRSHYVHLDSYSVRKGQSVTRGQQIGTLGRTGIKHDPAHLHFGLSRYQSTQGRYVYYDPEPKLRSWPLVAGMGGGLVFIVSTMALLYWWR